MRTISTEGFEGRTIAAGAVPELQWIAIADLVVDPTYHPAIVGKGRRKVNRIVRAFSWSCFSPVIVAAVAGGKFAIIDGQHRTTAAAVVGYESVPCQIVTATREEQAVAFSTINGATNAVSRMTLQEVAHGASEHWAVRLADICARADVELLRYPVPADRQTAGQTMAVGAIAQCLKRYGEETLITALQCVTQTTNNRPGVLSARMIKALCAVLHSDQERRDSGLALLEEFDAIDLMALQRAALVDAAVKKINSVQAISEKIRSKIGQLLPNQVVQGPAQVRREGARGHRIAAEFRGSKPPVKRVRPSHPS
jgi:hypothetical protein